MNRTSQMYTENVTSDFIKRSYVKKNQQDILGKSEEKHQEKTIEKEPLNLENDVAESKTNEKAKDKISSTKIKRKRMMIFLIGIFFIGMLYGALLVNNSSSNFFSDILEMNNTFLDKKLENISFNVFVSSFLPSIMCLILSYLSGFSAISQIIPLLLIFIKGLGYGSYMGSLYTTYGMNGFAFSVFAVVPSAFFVMFALLLSCRESVCMSNRILKSLMIKTKIDGEENKNTQVKSYLSKKVLKMYTLRNIILILLIAISAVLDVFLSRLFANVIT